MKESSGEQTIKDISLKKWGLGIVVAARNYCNKHKKKK
jgi:hypothetical protein